MLNFSAISLNSSFSNSPPLSLRNLLGLLNMLIQNLRINLTIVAHCLFFMKHAWLYHVAWSIMCNIYPVRYTLKSSATVSLNYVANGKQTAGFGGECLYLLHKSHLFVTSWTISKTYLLDVPATLMRFLSLSACGCANCLCSLVIFLRHSVASSSSLIGEEHVILKVQCCMCSF